MTDDFSEDPGNNIHRFLPLPCPNLAQALQNGKRLEFYSEGKQKARVEAICANLYHQPSIVPILKVSIILYPD